jgi:hypothetical protein
MVPPGEIREGMTVRTADGQAVGKVAAVGEVHFELEKGVVPIPRKDYLVEFSDVAAVRGHEVFLEEGATLVLEEDDDGSALPPRHHAAVDAEPVNTENLPH